MNIIKEYLTYFILQLYVIVGFERKLIWIERFVQMFETFNNLFFFIYKCMNINEIRQERRRITNKKINTVKNNIQNWFHINEFILFLALNTKERKKKCNENICNDSTDAIAAKWGDLSLIANYINTMRYKMHS